MGGGDGYGGYGGGFGAEDAWAEGDGLPGVVEEKLDFFGGPAALGADGEGDWGEVGGRRRGLLEGLGEGCGLFEFAEQDAMGARLLEESWLELGWIGDLGDGGAAGLFGGFERYAAPAIDAFAGGELEVFFCASGEDGGDLFDAEFGGFFDAPLEVVEFKDGEEEVEGEAGLGFELFVEEEVDLFRAGVGVDGSDFGAMEEAAGDDVVDLAGAGAEDAGEVGGLVAGEGGGGGGPAVGDEAAAGHLRGFRAGEGMGAQGWAGVPQVSTGAVEGWLGMVMVWGAWW